MKLLSSLMAIGLLVTVTTGKCFSQSITTPQVSPAAEISQTIGISRVIVKYSRPSIKGRQVWGDLVPYGWNVQAFGLGNSAPWRAGANENTTITFSDDVKVEGVKVQAGTYGLFFVINKDNSGEVILSKSNTAWGSFFYDQAEDLMRAKIQIRENSFTEMLTYDFLNITKGSGELVLNWEEKQFPVKLEFEVDALVMANAKRELQGPVGFSAQGYISAADYSFESSTDVDQGMNWVNQALAMDPTNFDALRIKSRILVRKGKATEADKLINDALLQASENDITNYGYQLLGLRLHDKAIKVFTTGTERFPASANIWDSLGEAYALKGDKENAIKNFKKSLKLNPSKATRANSEKYLRELGAM